MKNNKVASTGSASSVVAPYIAGFLGCAVLLGCSEGPSEGDASNHVVSTVEPLEQNEGVLGESTSPRAVMLRWIDRAATRSGIDTLECEAENTTTQPIQVRFELSALDQEDGTLSREVGERRIPANSSVSLQVPLSVMPVQTSKSATSVTVSARYDSAAYVLGDDTQTVIVQTATEPRLVTFDDAFSQATVRTLSSQVDFDSQNAGKALENRGLRRLHSGNGFAAARAQSVVAALVQEVGPSDGPPTVAPPESATEVQ